MADGGYYEPYPGLDSSSGIMPPMSGYRGHAGPESYDGSTDQKPAPFYSDTYSQPQMPPTSAGSGASGMLDPAATSSQDFSTMSGLVTSAAHMGGMYEQQIPNPLVIAPPIKSEASRRMPPTPPGSPEDSKDLNLQAGMHPAMASSLALAKPVPMKRLSERSIAHARASLGSVAMGTDPLADPMYGPSSAIARAMALTHQTQRRPRSEKKPIPDDAKDGKYFERRKRNNLAAKKSRDSRKSREDEIAIRASFLEKENAILRAQVATLREEANSLRQLLLQKKSRPAGPSTSNPPPVWGDMPKS